MNKSYRVIFNHAKGAYQCVAEFAKAKGKTKSIKALAVAIGLVMSGASFGADLELTNGQTHTIEGNRAFDGTVLIGNPNTKAVIKGQLVFGNGENTTANINNQAVVESNNDIAISAGQNAVVTVDNASLQNKSGVLALGLTPPHTAKLIGKNGAKITSAGIISIANVDNSTASLELSGQNTTLNGTVINVGEQSGSQGALSLTDKAKVSADQLLVGRNNGATGTLSSDNSTIRADSLVIGVYGNGNANLVDSKLDLSESYILADGANSVANVTSKKNLINSKFATIGTTGNATLNSTNDRYILQTSLAFGQEAGSKATAIFENSDIRATDMNLAVLTGSQAQVTIQGANADVQLGNEAIIGGGGSGTLTLDKTSKYNVGNIRASGVTVGGSSEGGTTGTTGGTGTLIIKDSTLVTDEIMVGNTGKGTLRLEANDKDTYLTGLYTKQISRNANSAQSDIFINGAEIGITADQPNLFANFTNANKIELGNKGVTFETENPTTGTNVIINPNAVLTGNAGTIDFDDPDVGGGFLSMAKAH
ncbi:ESPR domain-containing protein [Moraxella oblonga]|uniref:ESPR domain-containing protein n=1 Tax=Moraxella oblonga TaxID=200413 RepID=UPI00082B6033|nr:ESPR domain-containing protein [Moraxella oblonga]